MAVFLTRLTKYLFIVISGYHAYLFYVKKSLVVTCFKMLVKICCIPGININFYYLSYPLVEIIFNNQNLQVMKTRRRGYYFTRKIGECEFLVRIHYMPLFIIRRRIRLGVTMIPSTESIESLERSVFIKHSDMEDVINKLISNYLAEVGFFKIA